MSESQNAQNGSATPYLVLARKYRPRDFSSLIGQDAMVRTFANAFKANRIHHAFILTGVRGVGKTTTARILARAFNYEDENGPRPTLELEKPGIHCQAIIEGRHVDVIEMDAASNTGIDDIREIIDSVKYAPASAPCKVYIIDEVHMLSRQAFNGLLKTLEEPPPHVKFIFATTEIRKVPVTVLSRCQRFDLRRISPETMTAYLADLLGREKMEFEPDALSMIVRAGEGSVRDCLSLTDQAIAHGDGRVAAETVRTMLGLADRGQSIDLFENLLGGQIARALEIAGNLYDAGTDPEAIISDLARFTHLVSRMKVVAETARDPSLTPDERTRGARFAEQLGMRVLTRTWQILQNGLGEVARAPDAVQALEMVLIRLAHAADLPTPDELVEKLSAASSSPRGTAGPGAPAATPSGPGPAIPQGQAGLSSASRGPVALAHSSPPLAHATMDEPAASAATRPELASPRSFADIVALASKHRALLLKHALETDMRPISFEPGRLEVALTGNADKSIISTLCAQLKQWTGRNWLVTVSSDEGDAQKRVPTIREAREAEKSALHQAARGDRMVRAVLEVFPDAELVQVRTLQQDDPAAKE